MFLLCIVIRLFFYFCGFGFGGFFGLFVLGCFVCGILNGFVDDVE